MKNETNEIKEITVATLLTILKKFLLIVIISSVVFGIAMGAYAAFFTKTRYNAKIEFVVVNVLDENPYISDSMLGAASDITATCVELVNKNVFISEVVEAHGLDEYFGCDKKEAIKKVSSMINSEKISEESSVFSVSVTSLDQDAVYKVICGIQETMPTVVEELYKLSEESQITTTIKPITAVNDASDVQALRSSVVKYTALGLMLGFVLSYVIAFLIYINDTKVYDEETIKSNFTMPVIGAVPNWDNPNEQGQQKKKKIKYDGSHRDYEGKLINSKTPFGVVEAFNALRTNICYSLASEKCPVFAITSDFSGAGKSVISANVAKSLALLGKKTLLVECDLRRPELEGVFKTKAGVGLSDYLTGEVKDIDKIIKNIECENLSVVFSGKIPPNPSELLGSRAMEQFIVGCKENYDIIIVDTPPSFEVADIGIMSSFVSGTVIVARSYYSDVSALKYSCELISGVNGKIIGFVVNDVNYKSAGYYKNRKYGYRAYRRYGKYYHYSSYSENSQKQ